MNSGLYGAFLEFFCARKLRLAAVLIRRSISGQTTSKKLSIYPFPFLSFEIRTFLGRSTRQRDLLAYDSSAILIYLILLFCYSVIPLFRVLVMPQQLCSLAALTAILSNSHSACQDFISKCNLCKLYFTLETVWSPGEYMDSHSMVLWYQSQTISRGSIGRFHEPTDYTNQSTSWVQLSLEYR